MTPPRRRAPGPSRAPGQGGRGRDQGRPKRRPARVLGGEQVEGRRAVRELLAARRRRAHDVWVSEGAGSSALLSEITDLAGEQRVPVRTVARDRLTATARTEAPQGVLAHADPLPEADLDQLAQPEGQTPPFLVLLDGVTDPHNVGALLRTAECAGVSGAVLPQHGAAAITPTVTKVAAGAVEHVPLATASSIAAALARLRGFGLWTVGLDADAGQSLFDLPLGTEPLALVLGSEGRGVSRLALERCDAVVAIPQRGSLASLNVAAAGAVACFEVARRRASSAQVGGGRRTGR